MVGRVLVFRVSFWRWVWWGVRVKRTGEGGAGAGIDSSRCLWSAQACCSGGSPPSCLEQLPAAPHCLPHLPLLTTHLQELYMNKDLLKRLRGAAGAAQPTSAAAATGAPKPHHHFRLRPAGEAPSGGQPGGGPGRPQQQSQQPAAAAHAPSGTARGATPLQRPGGGAGGSRAPGAAPVGSTARLGRPQPTDIDSMFLPRKPSLPRPAGLAVRVIRVLPSTALVVLAGRQDAHAACLHCQQCSSPDFPAAGAGTGARRGAATAAGGHSGCRGGEEPE